MRARISALTNLARAQFDRFRNEWGGGVTLVAVFGGLTAFVGQQQLDYLSRGCDGTVDMVRLEVTFSAPRFAAMLLSAGNCAGRVARSFVTWDLIYPPCYALFLYSMFVWTERWRRFLVDGRRRAAYHEPEFQRDLVVLAPFAAALLDMVFENVPLWYAARALVQSPGAVNSLPVVLSVWLGSLAALLKWLIVLFAVVQFAREFIAGPRGAVLRRARFSVLAVALGALPLLAVQQGQDILQRVFEGDHPYLRFLSAVPPILLAAIAVWYFGRKLLELRLPDDPDRSDGAWYLFFAQYVPRVLGIVVMALAGLAFARAGLAAPRFLGFGVGGILLPILVGRIWPLACARIGRPFMLWWWKGVKDLDDRIGRVIVAAVFGLGIWLPWVPGPTGYLRVAAYFCLLSAWLMQLFVRFRRATRAVRSLGAPIRGSISAEEVHPSIDTIDAGNITPGMKRGVAAIALVSLAFLAAFTAFPVAVGRSLGPLWILAVATVNAAFIGSVSVWAGRHYGLPIVRTGIVLAVLFSFWNDNHAVRMLASSQNGVSRQSVDAHFDQWLTARRQERAGQTVPVVLVAAAGGGLRAAYWTAISLAVIQDQTPAFARHLFAFSGVSGGSLGGTLFTALVRDNVTCRVPPPNPERLAQLPDGPFTACVHNFMRDDFLSPMLAKLVAPDFLQWFLPIGIRAFDRSTGLERSWEASYRDTTGRNTFAEGFVALTRDAKEPLQVPALFLNSTHVETGRRYLAASLVQADGSIESHRFQDARDVLDILHTDIPLSTAIHNSARFTYVSPAGHLDAGDARENGRVVDGGYFENSGLATLREIYDALRARGVDPIVLYLCNDPATCDAKQPYGDEVASTAADEVLSPVRALLRTRDARGTLARANLVKLAGNNFLELNVCGSGPSRALVRGGRLQADLVNGVPATPTSQDQTRQMTEAEQTAQSQVEQGRERVVSPPLGWLLSQLAREWMDNALAGAYPLASGDCYQRNAEVLRVLREEILR